jgi:hypothetical protein
MTVQEHEAWHAVACLLLHVPFLEINTVGDPERGFEGWVRMGKNTTTLEESLRVGVAIAAPIARGEGRQGLEWPIDPSASKDHHDLARLALKHGWRREIWEIFAEGVLASVASNKFKRLLASVTGIADVVPVLGDREIAIVQRDLL